MTQRGWGYAAQHVDRTQIRNVEWTFEPFVAFDVWIDDVVFYR